MPITSSGTGMLASRVRSLMGRSFIESAVDVRGCSRHAVRTHPPACEGGSAHRRRHFHVDSVLGLKRAAGQFT